MSGEAPAIPVRMQVYTTAIPMKGFEHAAAARNVSEAVIVRVDLADGAVGWGEALPRAYVTGETIETVVDDLENVFWPAMAGRPTRPEDVARIAATAATGERLLNAAACAAELAVIRDWTRGEGVSPSRPEGILPSASSSSSAAAAVSSASASTAFGEERREEERRGQDALATPERDRPVFPTRVSGVLGSGDPDRTARQLRLMRWFGLRDFKLKVGLTPGVDAGNLRVVTSKLGRAIRRGKCTLRVDANSAWDAGTVPERTAELAAHGVCVVEQPADVSAAEMVELSRKCKLPLMADESLLTARDAEALLKEPRIWWSIRIAKNGGLLPALALCRRAAAHGVSFVCGCLVGETGILSAAQRRLLALAPRPRFIEGNYGRFLLRDDLTKPSLRFGYGGRLRRLAGRGLGVTVDEDKVHRYGKLVKTLTA